MKPLRAESANQGCEYAGVGFDDGERSTDKIVPTLVVRGIGSEARISGVGRTDDGRVHEWCGNGCTRPDDRQEVDRVCLRSSTFQRSCKVGTDIKRAGDRKSKIRESSGKPKGSKVSVVPESVKTEMKKKNQQEMKSSSCMEWRPQAMRENYFGQKTLGKDATSGSARLHVLALLARNGMNATRPAICYHATIYADLSDKMKILNFLYLPKSHRRARSKARSEISPIEDQRETGLAVPRLTGSDSSRFGHVSKVETIKSNGGLQSGSPSNHRMIPTKHMAESMASGSVMFQRTQETQRALSVFCLRMPSRFRARTRSPGPL